MPLLVTIPASAAPRCRRDKFRRDGDIIRRERLAPMPLIDDISTLKSAGPARHSASYATFAYYFIASGHENARVI